MRNLFIILGSVALLALFGCGGVSDPDPETTLLY